MKHLDLLETRLIVKCVNISKYVYFFLSLGLAEVQSPLAQVEGFVLVHPEDGHLLGQGQREDVLHAHPAVLRSPGAPPGLTGPAERFVVDVLSSTSGVPRPVEGGGAVDLQRGGLTHHQTTRCSPWTFPSLTRTERTLSLRSLRY